MCTNDECDQATALAECNDEISIAKADPGFGPGPHLWWCKAYTPYVQITNPNGSASSLNEYQNTFWYTTYSVSTKKRPYLNLGAPDCPNQCFGDPVDAATGNKFESRVEFAGEGPFPLRLEWTYNSHRAPTHYDPALKILGRNRTHHYFRRVNLLAGTTAPVIYLSRPDGKSLRFTPSGPSWVADTPNAGQLLAIADDGIVSGWRFEDRNGGSEVFDASGKLLELYSASGFRQVLAYDATGRLSTVTDPTGRSMTFDYNSEGLVSQAHLPDGQQIAFLYTSGGDLQRVDYPGGGSREYRYDESGYVATGTPKGTLTGVIDEAQNRYSTTTYAKSLYSSYAQVGSVYQAGGADSHSAVYQLASTWNYATEATVTLPSGATRKLTFAIIQGVARPLTVTNSCAGCISQVTTYAYDAMGRVDTVTRDGVVTDFDYNSRGLETRKVEAANDSSRRRTLQTDWLLDLPFPIERRTYDASGALVSKSSWTYNSRGQVLTFSQTEPVSDDIRTSAFTYCEQPDVDTGTCPLLGLLLSTDGPRTDISDVTNYRYYGADDPICSITPTACHWRRGDLWRVTNAQGQVTETLRYDGAGRVLSTKDSNDVITDFAYDPRGRLTGRTTRASN